MYLTLEENLKLCDWLLEKGLGIGECACLLCDLESGDTFALALLKVFHERKLNLDSIHDKNNVVDWGNPIVP